jgi:hypothetical protein
VSCAITRGLAGRKINPKSKNGMLFLKHVLTLVHVITAAAWFGMGLRLAAQARAVLNLDRPAALALADDTARTVRLMGLFIVLTLVFAFATFFVGGGFSGYSGRVQFHLAFSLIIVLAAIQYFLVQPGWTKLRDAVEAGADATAFRKRVAMGVSLGHLLWLVLLVLMFWDKLGAAL